MVGAILGVCAAVALILNLYFIGKHHEEETNINKNKDEL